VAHELFLLNERLGIHVLQLDQIAKVQEFVEQWRGISPAWILLALALVPGVCEEFFFRGMLYSSLRSITSPWRTILISAVVFGLFHVVAGTILAPERFLPSMMLGMVLGWVRHRTQSVVPCMALHTVHNGLLLSVAYWRDALAARGFGVEEASHLPLTWLAVAACGALAALALLAFTTRLPSSQAS
jgi:ABC-2 type transport system permease protein/sodium transport system permease protein